LFGDAVIQAVFNQSGTKKTSTSHKKAQSPKAVPLNPKYGACPQCGKALVKRSSKHGEFVGCSGFPKCRFTKNLS
jgi:predicted RNA-binding Zn-ribbon protein involved in translation (DUF1610 family)